MLRVIAMLPVPIVIVILSHKGHSTQQDPSQQMALEVTYLQLLLLQVPLAVQAYHEGVKCRTKSLKPFDSPSGAWCSSSSTIVITCDNACFGLVKLNTKSWGGMHI